MGNSECCEEKTKGGEFNGGNTLFQPNRINLQPNKPNINSTQHQYTFKKSHQNASSANFQRSPPPKIINKHSGDDLPIIQQTSLKSKKKDEQMSQEIEAVNNKINEHNKGEQRLKQNLFRSEEPKTIQRKLNLKQVISQQDNQSKIPQEEALPDISMPQLSEPVRNTLQSKRFFQEKFNFNPLRRRFKQDFYEGQLEDQGKLPHGLGKLYKADHSYYIGNFVKGKAHGEGAFIFPDGSYYSGPFINNYAEGKGGVYHSSRLHYEGEFQRNCFHGKGSQSGQNHRFVGEYYNNLKTEGLLIWNEGQKTYEYQGTFDNNIFSGRGTLKQPTGTYNGQFIAGKKHGLGDYEFSNGLKYIGQYREGVRNGKGAIYNPNNKIAYQGDFQNGLPHGKGIVMDKNGNKDITEWVEGIDKEFL